MEVLKFEKFSYYRYKNYDIADLINYKREMITLHIPFRNEAVEILAEIKFLTIYDENENTILERRKEFEKNIDRKNNRIM